MPQLFAQGCFSPKIDLTGIALAPRGEKASTPAHGGSVTKRVMQDQETPRTMAQEDMTSWLEEVNTANETATVVEMAAIDELSEALEASYAAEGSGTDTDEEEPGIPVGFAPPKEGDVWEAHEPEDEDREQAALNPYPSA